MDGAKLATETKSPEREGKCAMRLERRSPVRGTGPAGYEYPAKSSSKVR